MDRELEDKLCLLNPILMKIYSLKEVLNVWRNIYTIVFGLEKLHVSD
jgi:hypothetical protein